MIVQPQSNILEVGVHQHQWARSVGGGMGFEECVVCHTRRSHTPILSGIGGFAVQAPSLPGANPKAEEKLMKGMEKPISERMAAQSQEGEEPQFVVAGPRTVTDTLTGLPPQSYHMSEPPENEDDAPTVAQLTGFAITPVTNVEDGEVVDPRDESSGGQKSQGEQGSDPSDDEIRGMRKTQLTRYARERGLAVDESMERDQLAEDIVSRRQR